MKEGVSERQEEQGVQQAKRGSSAVGHDLPVQRYLVQFNLVLRNSSPSSILSTNPRAKHSLDQIPELNEKYKLTFQGLLVAVAALAV
jgi:hypothetical protein